MNIYLIIAILLANLIGIAIVYQFIKKLEKKQRILFIGIGFGLMYILITVIYWFSGFGIDKEVHEASKKLITYLFVPVNVILIVPYYAAQYMKYKTKQIDREKLAKRITILAVFFLIVVVVEFFAFRNIQNNIKNILTTVQNGTKIQKEQTDLNTTTDNTTNNLTELNEIANEEVKEINEIANEEIDIEDFNINSFDEEITTRTSID